MYISVFLFVEIGVSDSTSFDISLLQTPFCIPLWGIPPPHLAALVFLPLSQGEYRRGEGVFSGGHCGMCLTNENS